MLAIVRIALGRPYTFVVMAILIVIFGVTAWMKTPTDIFPNIGIPVIAVVWTYDGLPADDMSKRVVYYYERTVSTQVNDIEHIESQSLPRYGVVKIFFQPKVNINAALAQVTAASQTVLKLLPPGITPPFVLRFSASTVPVLQLALSSKTLSQERLFDAAQNFIRPQLATVAGAAIASPYGGKFRQVQIDLNQQELAAYGLSAQDVVSAIGQQNIVTPVGTEKIGSFEYNVSLNGSPTRLEALNDLPIRVVNGATVFIRDVAYVHDGSPPQINMVRVDGHNAVLMTILKAGSASTLDVINGVKRLLPKLRETLPASLHLDAIGDQSAFVNSAVNSVVFEGVVAASLTGLMILLFLGSWRSTLIITISIPLAVLASIAALSALGETINVMTLGGLALAVGILVDDATVTIENINWHLEQDKDIENAIMDGARQIVIPATVSLLCICIVFVPMFTLGGVAGFLFRPMAEAVVFALMASYVLSRTLVSTMARYLLANGPTHVHGEAPRPTRNPLVLFQRGFEHRFERVRFGYQRLLTTALGGRWIFIAGFLIAVGCSFALTPFLGQNFFPSVESPQIKLHVRAQTGTRIEETARLCDKVEDIIRATIPPNALGTMVDNIGLPISGINSAYNNSGTVGPSDADILISLKPGHQGKSEEFVKQLRETLPQSIPGATFAFLPADIVSQILNFGLPSSIDVQVVGPDQLKDSAYADLLLKRIQRVVGVADARVQQAFNNPTLKVAVDRARAAQVGLNEGDVAKSLQDTLSGSFKLAPTFWINPKNGVAYQIVAQTPQYWLNSVSNLENVPATQGDTSQILGSVATLSRGVSPAVVSHYAVQPVVDIYATNTERDLGAVSADIEQIIKETAKEAPPGSTVVMRGQTSIMASAYSQLYIGLTMAVVLIFLLIVVNFQSWLDPFVIVSALPTALAGVVWMLFVTRTTLSVPALTGAIMCMGVATANSILVVSFARERLADGADALTAAIDAGFTRFRPVLMTALAMIIGMAPMALSAEQNAPLGRAVIGGLIFATVATLFFVPAVFRLVHDRQSDLAADASPGAQAQAKPI
ncbi:MAG: efflux RND transporter permease subunit [Bradyrhizobium sp.]|uniref:efflux RND transporter permease subunit n=1 Tax=Bradyrhizobium sp. TaxID=376 RepID=UPI001C2A1923|nr:efflux RND transporter permease subunit [Bradyrhizobium sp.]MBU6463266.1 efflux RND transporter permease subunit [Pseudomonadota bacterium]MDE2066625.1 efflux RND transporter permease subunit [Bradyrhizobium sp.]MDE2467994.1 efflux RND transporter permease subunit [Bradyrhizobium sp.]